MMYLKSLWGFPGGSDGKESAYNAGDPGLIPGLERSPREGGEWQLTPVFLPGEFHGQRSLMDSSSWGCKESDMTERLNQTEWNLEKWYLRLLFSS